MTIEQAFDFQDQLFRMNPAGYQTMMQAFGSRTAWAEAIIAQAAELIKLQTRATEINDEVKAFAADLENF